MLKCDSCSKSFQRAGGLFEHIQSSCLAYYKSHPQAWAKILSKLGSENDGDNDQPKSSTLSPPRNVHSRALGTSRVYASTKSDMPSSFSQIASKAVPFVCKCEAQFKKLENFKAHLKACTPGKEPPFCIMFRAQDAESGKNLKNVHMTVNDYFYGAIAGKQVKMKKVNRRCNCYSCGKNLRNNIRYMSHVRHKIINEWEKKEAIDARNICQHCYRQYDSSFLLQCHVENVHGALPAACTCRICEVHFPSERSFLFHMKDKHVHNEAPYICKVCNYRSSFYNDVIKHFRDEHSDTSALMCPFCLAVSFNSGSFLRHVLQHIKKGVECRRCRLIFANMKEKATHLQTDHMSQVISEKLRKYRNLQKCQIYVRVASFQMAQRQHLMQKSPEQFSDKGNGTSLSVKRHLDDTADADGWQAHSPHKKPSLSPMIELPPYLCSLKKTQKMKKVRLPKSQAFYRSSLQCMECGDTLQKDSPSIVQHFQHVHECRWCVFITSCEKASVNHVLRQHADAELREQLVGKTESDDMSSTATLDDDINDRPVVQLKKEPEIPPLPMNICTSKSDTSNGIEKSDAAIGSPPVGGTHSSKPRRKQSNPMKILGTGFEITPSLTKKVRREKKIQARGFEAEKGTQACDLDFKSEKPKALEVDINSATVSKEKATAKPAASSTGKSNPAPTAARHRKILAPEGYFPDIDDDEGWAKYFAEVEGQDKDKDKDKTSNRMQTQKPKVDVPQTAATPIMPNKDIQTNELSKSARKAGTMLVTRHDVTQSAAPAVRTVVTSVPPQVSNISTSASTDPTNVQPLWTQKNDLPSVVPTAGPVFRFQVVPGSNTLIPAAGGFSPGANAVRPISQTNLVSKFQKMLSQVPQSPVDLRCLEFTHSSMLIQWDAPSNCVVTQYKVIFQGSGAPTVQLLPPEQTLVRLVGLKSDTMYVVRVYTLCNKAVSQYAFLYQRTNKMPRDVPRSCHDDVVLVVDDEPLAAKVANNKPSSAAMASKVQTQTVANSSNVPVPQSLSKPTATLNSGSGPFPPTKANDLKQNMKTLSNKKTVIDEVLSSLKKNKAEKVNGPVMNMPNSSSFTDNTAVGLSDGKNMGTVVGKGDDSGKVGDAVKSSDGVELNVLGDNIEKCVKGMSAIEQNLSVSSLASDDSAKVSVTATVSKHPLCPILPKPPVDKVTLVKVISPEKRQLHATCESDVSQTIATFVGNNNEVAPNNLDDKTNIPTESSSEEVQSSPSKSCDVEVNIVNVISLSNEAREENHDQLEAGSGDGGLPAVIPSEDVETLGDAEDSMVGDKNQVFLSNNENGSGENAERVQDVLSGSSSGDEEPVEKSEPIDNIVIVLNDNSNTGQEVVESLSPGGREGAERKVNNKGQNEDGLVCEIRIDEPIQSSEISQSQDAVVHDKSSASQQLKADLTSTANDVKSVLEETSTVEGRKVLSAKENSLTVFIDDEQSVGESNDVCGTDIDDAIDKELSRLGADNTSSGTTECGNGPTLDDIKDIMDAADLTWL